MLILMARHKMLPSSILLLHICQGLLKIPFFSKKAPSWSPFLNHHCVLILLPDSLAINYSLVHIILCSMCTHFPSLSWLWVPGFLKIRTLNVIIIMQYFSAPERIGHMWWLILVLFYSGEQVWKACLITVQRYCLALLYRELSYPSLDCNGVGCQFCTLLFPHSLAQCLSYGRPQKYYFNELFCTW